MQKQFLQPLQRLCKEYKAARKLGMGTGAEGWTDYISISWEGGGGGIRVGGYEELGIVRDRARGAVLIAGSW